MPVQPYALPTPPTLTYTGARAEAPAGVKLNGSSANIHSSSGATASQAHADTGLFTPRVNASSGGLPLKNQKPASSTRVAI